MIMIAGSWLETTCHKITLCLVLLNDDPGDEVSKMSVAQRFDVESPVQRAIK